MLPKKDIKISADGLFKLLATSQILAIKTQNFHWNVVDLRFYMLHELFAKQYKELVEAVDEIAERIRFLQIVVSATASNYLKNSIIDETVDISSGKDMLEILAKDHQLIVNFLRNLIETVSLTNDQGTLDFLINRLQYHEKAVWFIASHID